MFSASLISKAHAQSKWPDDVRVEEMDNIKVSWYQILMSTSITKGNCSLIRYRKHDAFRLEQHKFNCKRFYIWVDAIYCYPGKIESWKKEAKNNLHAGKGSWLMNWSPVSPWQVVPVVGRSASCYLSSERLLKLPKSLCSASVLSRQNFDFTLAAHLDHLQ